MATQTKKGASPLQLNNKELRRELICANAIIQNAQAVMIGQQVEYIADLNAANAKAPTTDPFRFAARRRAMHRITPKPDYVKVAFFVLILILTVSFIASQADNQLLRAQLAQVQGE